MITKKSYNKVWEYVEECGRTSEKWELEVPTSKENIILRLSDSLTMEPDGRIEVVWRFTNLNNQFYDTNPNTYKTYKGAIRWLEKNGYERVA